MVGEAKVFRQQDWVEPELRFEIIAGEWMCGGSLGSRE
jgi:hypothetical protein